MNQETKSNHCACDDGCDVSGVRDSERGRVMSVINAYGVYLFIPEIHARSCQRGKLICLTV